MAEGLVITHTDLATFLRCRRQWRWAYVDDFHPPPRLDGHAPLGERVHKALALYYGLGSDPVAEHDRIGREDVERLEGWSRPGWQADALYKDIVIGRACLTAFMEWVHREGEDSPYEVEAVEQTVQAPILDGQVILRGKVDVLFRAKLDGFLYVNDHKTTGAWTSIREGLERSWQHHVYLAVLMLAMPTEIVAGAMYTVMHKVANPARATRPLVERFRVPGTTKMAAAKLAQIERICEQMLATMEAIERGGIDHAYPTPQDACRWCDYRQPCDLIDESPLAAREMLDRVYIRGGRHGRYDHSLV
jgi:PD-(D/E)XK nuclease superfamily